MPTSLPSPIGGNPSASNIANSIASSSDVYNMMMQLPVAIAILEGPHHVFVLANASYQHLFGRSGDQLTGKTVKEVFPESEEQGFHQLLDSFYQTGHPRAIPELPAALHINGETATRYYECHFQPLESLGTERRVLALAIDVTEKVMARKRIEESQRHLLYRKALLEAQNEAVPDAMLVVDTKGKILSFNKRFATMWGIPQSIIEACDDRAALEFATTQVTDPEGFMMRVAQCYAHPDQPAGDEVFFKDGRIIERYGNAVSGEDGVSYGYIWYFRDVTDQRRKAKALQTSEDRYQNFISQSTEGIWRFEVDEPIDIQLPPHEQIRLIFQHGYLAECNDAMAQMYGFARSTELTGTRLNQMFQPDENTDAYFAHFISSGYKVENAERRVQDRYGQVRYFTNNLVGTLEEGKLVRAWGTQQDITSIKEAEEKRRQSEEKYRNLFETMEQGFCIVDILFNEYTEPVDYRFIEINPVFAKQSGLQNALGRTAKELIPTLEHHWVERYGRVALTGKSVRFTESSDAMNRWFDVYAFRLGGDGSQQVAILFSDVTERRLAEDALQKSEAQFRSLANAMPQLVWTAEPDGSVTYYNDRVAHYFGAQKGPDGHWLWQGMVHAADLKQTEAAWQQAVQRGVVYQAEHRVRMQDGSFRWHLSRGVPQRDATGQVTRWYGTATDIHEQKVFAEKLEQIVTERTEELRRSNEDLQQFAHVASHDLKEPVRKVITFSNRLKDELGVDAPERINTYLSKIENSANRMYAMIDGVLLYSSLNALEQSKERIDLVELLQTIESDLEIAIARKEATIRYGNLPAIEGSSILVYQLFYNLLNNALKFSKEGVRPLLTIEAMVAAREELVQLNLNNPSGYVKIVLQDNGIGFSPVDSEKIFGTFTRLHAKDRFEGTGLGLSLCRKIAERHGGRIYATGVEGYWAQFVIIWPQ